jgi:hypothetical protein
MKFKVFLGVVFVAMVLIINSCENKAVPVPGPAKLAATCDTLSIKYSSGTNNIKAIIDLQCGTSNTSCHSPGSVSGYDYSSYSAGGLQANNARGWLYSALFKGTPTQMPKVPQPGWSDSSACMLAKLKAWIDAGIPQ